MMRIKYEEILKNNPDRQDVLRRLDEIKEVLSYSDNEFELILNDNCLERGFDPENVKQTDIRVTNRAFELADRVVYEGSGRYQILKEKDGVDLKKGDAISAAIDYCKRNREKLTLPLAFLGGVEWQKQQVEKS